MAKHLLALAVALMPLIGSADIDILPDDVRLDSAIPSPQEFLGFEPGDWHVRHDQVVAYMRHLAELSPRVSVHQYGASWEQRPLLLVTITSPENQANLDSIQAEHAAGRGSKLILWQGFSVHGNEASGTHASMNYAHFLAAASNAELEDALRDIVVLIDPSINPDGFDRFVNWVNSHKAENLVADRLSREHQEAWPNGRTNHYWFDLNRDWLLLTHPESRARIAEYQRWRPHVLTDHHEMGSDSTYFFQPGVPERKHPLTPARNEELTQALAEHHAKALDSVGELYFTREQFDDFYYGKGSTYPDIQGTIGILFEQASARGHVMNTVNGPLTFRRAIRNQVRTAISTFEGARANAAPLMAYQVGFDQESARLAAKDPVKGYIFGDQHDTYRARKLAGILSQHGIDVFEVADTVEIDKQRFTSGHAYVAPTNQRQYRLIKAVMETRTSFEDTVFYDVSTWTLPLAFGLDYAPLRRLGKVRGDAFQMTSKQTRGPQPGAYAYVVSWADYKAPAVLQQLLEAGVRVRAATKPVILANGVTLPRGSLVIARGLNGDLDESFVEILRSAAEAHEVDVYSVETGLNWQGRDLGSATFRTLKPIRPALLVDGKVQGYDAGEVWHLLDQRVGLPLALIRVPQFDQLELHRYTHLLMVDGNYESLSEEVTQRLRQWIKSGGTLVATRRAADWATRRGLHQAEAPPESDAKPEKEDVESEPPDRGQSRYGDHQKEFSLQIIGGAILRGELDITHPVGFGYEKSDLALFRQGRTRLEVSDNPYRTPLRYAASPRISGFIASERLEELSGSAAVVADKVGRGSVVRFADNPNFRGFWYGTNRLYLNALFFSQLIEPTLTEPVSP